MNKLILALSAVLLLGAQCAASPAPSVPESGDNASSYESAVEPTPEVVLPITQYGDRRTLKQHGEYIEDRFSGYHVGDDIEYQDVDEEVPVYAIAPGVVRKLGRVAGYGGLAIIGHTLADGTAVNALYGHLDLGSSQLAAGDSVEKGEVIANLGDHESAETDGERKHLHFALYQGSELRVNGYEKEAAGISRWLNPTDFFVQHGGGLTMNERVYDPETDRGGAIFHISFTIPKGMEVEYVPQIQSLNVFSLQGEGTARERSQVFIRYFDASNFLTLSTVTIHKTEDTAVGAGDYAARQYDIQKLPGVADFPYQPTWRNARHTVTDFRTAEGFTRYYVVAANPQLDAEVYTAMLSSLAEVKP